MEWMPKAADMIRGTQYFSPPQPHNAGPILGLSDAQSNPQGHVPQSGLEGGRGREAGGGGGGGCCDLVQVSRWNIW